MAKVEAFYVNSFDSIGTRKRKGVPLPYLIRPRRVLPLCDSFSLYNDYVEYSSLKDGLFVESDDDDLPIKAVETLSLSEADGLSYEKDEDYVLVSDSETEQEGAIQMMDLSKDTDESDNAGWVVVY